MTSRRPSVSDKAVPSTGRLFDPDALGGPPPAPPRSTSAPEDPSLARPAAGDLVVRIQPDVSGLDKQFDYVIPPELADRAEIGSLVRVELGGRRVAGWITAMGSGGDTARDLRSVIAVSSVGPSADLVDLARWAAHRWGGRFRAVLKSASPPRQVATLPRPQVGLGTDAAPRRDRSSPPAQTSEVGVPLLHRLAPSDDPVSLVASLAAGGLNLLVIVPTLRRAREMTGALRRSGLAPRLHPRDWVGAASRGGIVVGARSAVWARIPDLAGVVVIDEHDEALQEERNPTWHARDVAIERAARLGVPCHLVSPAPSLTAVAAARSNVITPARTAERAGWPVVEIVDRRGEEPGRTGLFSSRVAEVCRGPGRVVAVLNRKGRAVMLACSLCGELARTADGERLMVERDGVLVAPSTGEERPLVCDACGATRLKRLRLGVTRAAEELAALVGEPVDELTAVDDEPPGHRSHSRVVVGTEAVLHHIDRAASVVFLDFDAELLAPRYRAAEQAMALLVLAARMAGPRRDGGRVVVQTRTPDHRVLRAAVRADPGSMIEAEQGLRQPMGWPPYGALAEVTGSGGPELVAALSAHDPDVAVLGPRDGRYLVRADDPDRLAAVLGSVPRPAARVRVAVDPPRV